MTPSPPCSYTLSLHDALPILPKIFNLRSDPYERADITSNSYYDWLVSDGAGIIIAGPAVVSEFLATFKEYPPRDRKSTRLNSSHLGISYAVFCLKKKKKTYHR